MSFLWIQFKPYRPVKVPTDGCTDVDGFIEAIKKKLSHLLGSYDVAQLSLSLDGREEALRADTAIGDIRGNSYDTPLVVSVIVEQMSMEAKYSTC